MSYDTGTCNDCPYWVGHCTYRIICAKCGKRFQTCAGFSGVRCPTCRKAQLNQELEEEREMERMREFDTGATRSAVTGKIQYEGYLSPRVLRRFGEYMRKHQTQEDGALRDADNWQKGIPRNSYMDSLVRHVIDAWSVHRGCSKEDLEDLLCAILFNAQGYLFELLKARGIVKEALESVEEDECPF